MNKLLCCVVFVVIALYFIHSSVCALDSYQPSAYSYAYPYSYGGYGYGGYGGYGLGCAPVAYVNPCPPVATPFVTAAVANPCPPVATPFVAVAQPVTYAVPVSVACPPVAVANPCPPVATPFALGGIC